MNKTSIGIIALVLVVGAAFYFFNQKNEMEPLSTSSPSIAATDSPESDLLQGGSSYLDANGVYSFLYPNEYTLDTQDPVHIRIYKRGETQRSQSEMSDGVLLVFETLDLRGTTLEALVDKRISESTADGTSKVLEGKKARTLNTYPGFEYTLQGLGSAQHIALQKDPDSKNGVLIIYSISDPKQIGYQNEVNQVLSTLKLLK